jgi:mRNA interferase RelE/StbE
MSYIVQYKAESLENLEKLDRQVQSRIIKKIVWLAENFEDILPLALTANLVGAYKLRVGDYRVIYEFSEVDENITILKIGHRSEIYG